MAERIQDYSEPVTGMHINDIATISCIMRLLSSDYHYSIGCYGVCVLSKHSILITIQYYLLIIGHF